MSRRRREPAGRRRDPPAPVARARSRGGRWAAVALPGLAVVAFVIWWFGRHPSESRPRAPLADLPAGVAAERAADLVRDKRYLASLPYFERAIAEEPQQPQPHLGYAVALLNAVHETRTHLGHDEFAVRGSPERVAMVREALDHLIVVERMARAARDRHDLAWSLGTRGQMMAAWGLPWDAFAAYRQSEWSDSTVAEFAGKADRLMSAMEKPTSGIAAEVSER